MILSDLKQDEKARVMDYSNVDKLIRLRFFQLGMKEDKEISMKRKLPFGGPFIIESCGQCISIRKEEAKKIQVKPL